jgi:uncharacterized protein
MVQTYSLSAGKELLEATKRGDGDEVQKLIDGGANPDVKDDSGSTPLHIAVEAKNLDIVRRLLQSGADQEIANDNLQEPLHCATIDGSVEIMRLLLDDRVGLQFMFISLD